MYKTIQHNILLLPHASQSIFFFFFALLQYCTLSSLRKKPRVSKEKTIIFPFRTFFLLLRLLGVFSRINKLVCLHLYVFCIKLFQLFQLQMFIARERWKKVYSKKVYLLCYQGVNIFVFVNIFAFPSYTKVLLYYPLRCFCWKEKKEQVWKILETNFWIIQNLSFWFWFKECKNMKNFFFQRFEKGFCG